MLQSKHLKLRQDGDKWYVSFLDSTGSRKTVQFGTDYEQAQKQFDAFVEVYHGKLITPSLAKGLCVTIADAVRRYIAFCKQHYRKGNRQTSMARKARAALRNVSETLGHWPIAGFTAQHVRNEIVRLIEIGRSRKTCIDYLDAIILFMQWAVNEIEFPIEVLTKVRAITFPRDGRAFTNGEKTVAPVTRLPVTPPPLEHVEATIRSIRGPQKEVVADILRVMMLTGMRPSEALEFCPAKCDMQTSPDCWIYWPTDSKTQRFQDRKILIGPKAQKIIAQYWKSQDSERRLWKMRYNLFKWYTDRACLYAGVPKWNPNQLRHFAATEIASMYGVAVAQEILGHTKPTMTLRYMERVATPEHQAAARAMATVG